MTLHIPLTAAWSAFKAAKATVTWLCNKVTEQIALPVYRRSHALWVDRNRLGAHWRPLGSYLEYSIYVGKLTDPEPRHTHIAVRAREGVKVERASFVFEAASGFQRYQEPITLHNLDQRPIKWTTNNVPPDELVHASDQGIIFRWDTYRFTNIELAMLDRGGIKELDSLTSHLTHTWLLNSEWIRVSDVFLNLDAIKHCREDLAIYWRFGFCRPTMYHPGPRRRGLTIFDISVFLSRPLKAVMSSDLAVKVQFWLAALTFWRFSEEGKLVPRFAKGS